MSNIKKIFFAPALLCLWVVSCQQTPPVSARNIGLRNYSDAVVNINQVDPAYRAYFRAQDAANYSLSDQRRAYYAAAQTARTPVRASDYRPGNARRIAKSSGRRVTGKQKNRVARRTVAVSRRSALAVRRRVAGKR